MKETMAEMMARIQEGMPSAHWKSTSVGTVNFRNKSAVALAAIRLAKQKAAKENGGKPK